MCNFADPTLKNEAAIQCIHMVVVALMNTFRGAISDVMFPIVLAEMLKFAIPCSKQQGDAATTDG
eukprot:7137004-Pyramimonas_sp.AAC.1